MSRTARLARGWAIGSVATLVAAISHVVAGGAAPSALAMLLGTVFAGLVGTALIGRRAGLVRMSVIVAVSQVAFHLGFSLLSVGAVSVVSAGAHHHVITMTTPGAAMAHPQDDPAMWVGHAIAAAITVAYLHLVERSVWAVLASLGHELLRRLRIVVHAAPTRCGAAGQASGFRILSPARLTDAIARRGPPALLDF